MKTNIQHAFKTLLAPLGFSLGDITYETHLTRGSSGTVTEEFYGYNVVIYLKTYTVKAFIVTITNESEIERKMMDLVNKDLVAISHNSPAIQYV